MTFPCSACLNNKEDSEFVLLVIEKWGAGIKRYCRECRSPKAFVPDVYFDGKPEETLANDSQTGQPKVFFSKGHKAQYLKERGLMEAGDRVHGAPVSFSEDRAPKTDSRDEVRKALHKVKQMGQDVRRQEYLRITKGGR